MINLWRSIIQENDDKIIDKYYDDIMKEVIKGLQSTPLAVSNLIQGRRMNKIEKKKWITNDTINDIIN